MTKEQPEYYNKEYYDRYKSNIGEVEYKHGKEWDELFAKCADRIVKEIQPQKVLDVGCAKGFLVESLRDRGVEAYGIDISEYAISCVREDIKRYCKVESILNPIDQKYDLITCVEVLEHLDQKDISSAIEKLCHATDDIIFSSTPFDYEESSHVSVHNPEYWVEQFAYNGFYHDVMYDCSYISVQAMRFRRGEKTKIDLVNDYERVLFQKHQEVTNIRQCWKTSEENVKIYKDSYQKHVDMINDRLNPRIAELEECLQNLEEEREKEIQDRVNILMEKYKKELGIQCENREAQYAVRVREEVQKRKIFEEKYYLGCAQINELQKVEENLIKLRVQYSNLYREMDEMTLWRLIKRWRERRSLEKKLLKKDLQFWSPVFDADYYAEHNEDIAKAIGTDEKKLLKHFIKYGMYEGRIANSTFDVNVYINYNQDVVDYCKTDMRLYYLHYIMNGKEEKRRAR